MRPRRPREVVGDRADRERVGRVRVHHAEHLAQADALVGRKGQRSYTAQSRDLHEAAGDFMARVRQVYDDLAAAAGPSWRPIRVSADDGALRAPEEIAADAWHEIAVALPEPG